MQDGAGLSLRQWGADRTREGEAGWTSLEMKGSCPSSTQNLRTRPGGGVQALGVVLRLIATDIRSHTIPTFPAALKDQKMWMGWGSLSSKAPEQALLNLSHAL